MDKPRLFIILALVFALVPIYISVALAQDTTTTIAATTTTVVTTTTVAPTTTVFQTSTPCTVNSAIPSSGCNCGGGSYTSGYCCAPTSGGSNYWASSACGPTGGETCGNNFCGSGETTSSCPSDCRTCSEGAVPSSGCVCGGTTQYSGNCCAGTWYSTGGGCGGAPSCSSSSVWNCNTQSTCQGAGGTWCQSGSGGYCQSSGTCPTCSSSQVWNCYDQSSCQSNGGNWCTSSGSTWCSSSPCSGGGFTNPCPVGSAIPTGGCNCGGGSYTNGYCCSPSSGTGSNYWSSSPCGSSPTTTMSPDSCGYGSIPSSGCRCAGTWQTSGACCNGMYYASGVCPSQLQSCSTGPIPAAGCSCGGSNYYSGYCCTNVYYPNGPCPATTNVCSSSSTWNCYDQGSCTNVGGKWCMSSGTMSSGWCQSGECPSCSSSQIHNCYDQASCTGAGGKWCGNYCSQSSCPVCTRDNYWNCYSSGDCQAAGGIWCSSGGPSGGWCANTPCPTCSSSQPWNCNTESECRTSGGKWCNSYCTTSSCPTACGNGVCESGNGETANNCASDCGAACPATYDPVCGTDSRTYGNECQAKAAGVSVKFRGSCSTCGNFICEQGESSVSCPGDCKTSCPAIPFPTTPCMTGPWQPRYDDKKCVTGYDCAQVSCGNGRCEAGEYPSNCFNDCGQFCPQYTDADTRCARGYYVEGGRDPSGCQRLGSCCGDGICNGFEGGRCPEDCGADRPFCGNGRCDIGEDQYNCGGDCQQRECPPSIQCPDGSQKSCVKTDFGCRCDQCLISENFVPQGCRQQTNSITGTVNVICASGTQCPPLPRADQMEAECTKQGGKFVLAKDPAGCQYPDCQFVDGPTGPFTGYDKCHTQDEIEEIKIKCANLNLPMQIDVKGECKVATCGRPAEGLCDRMTPTERQQIEQKCRQENLYAVKVYDSSGCPNIECKEAFECPKELPEEAFKKCQTLGGEMIIKKDENGCVRFADCLRPGDDRDARIEPIEKIPEAPQLLEMAFKLEELRVKLDKLAKQADDVALYYESTNSPDAERWRRVADMFESSVREVDKIKGDLRNKIDDITIDDLMEVRHSIKYMSDVLLKDITYVMLSSNDEVKNLDEVKDCGTDERCFDRAFRRCQPLIFYPDGTRGPKVEVTGLENGACIMKASMSGDNVPPGFGPVDMTCKLENYARGVMDPETDVFPYCEGSMVELMKQYGTEGPGGGGGPEGPGGGPPPGLILAFLDNGKGPGGCVEKACVEYCDSNFNECLRYMDDWLSKNGGPGGARSLMEMGRICEDRSNGDVCFKWILERGVDPRDLGPGPDDQSRRREEEFQRFENGPPPGFEGGPPAGSEFGQPPGGQFGQPPSGGVKCPDGICDNFERTNNACPQDCGQFGQQTGGSVSTCPVGMYDCNRRPEDGCESRFPCG